MFGSLRLFTQIPKLSQTTWEVFRYVRFFYLGQQPMPFHKKMQKDVSKIFTRNMVALFCLASKISEEVTNNQLLGSQTGKNNWFASQQLPCFSLVPLTSPQCCFQNYRDTRTPCLGGPKDTQKELTKTLIVCLLKPQLFLLILFLLIKNANPPSGPRWLMG